MEVNASALAALGVSQAVTAHDVANMNTPGFRGRQVVLESGPADQGVRVAEIREDPSAGPLVPGRDGAVEEGSNVDLAQEIPQMMVDEMAYRANAAVIRTEDAMVGALLDMMA